MDTPEQTNNTPGDGTQAVNYRELLSEAQTNNFDHIAALSHAPIYRGPDKSVSELTEIIRKHVGALTDIPPRSDEVIDLTSCNPAAIIRALDHLTANANLVLHGGKTKQLLSELDPAHSMQSTEKTAVVNATSDAEAAAYYAVIDGPKFFAQIPSNKQSNLNFGVSLNVYGLGGERSFQIEADPVSQAVFEAHGDNPDFFSDGYLYILNRNQFRPSAVTPGQQTSDHEWSSHEAAKPLAVIRIPKELGPVVYADSRSAAHTPDHN